MTLMPWQQQVVEVALETNAAGRLVYREVDLTVPRQSGKTTLLLALMVHRAHGFGAPQTILYTAQNRIEARKKWEDEHVKALDRSALRNQYDVRKQIGQEAIRWNNGSMHGLTAPTEKAGHGATLDLGVIDEAFAREDHKVEQAMRPAMITRTQPQLWVVSTAGTKKSTYLRKKVDDGRKRVEAGISTGVAYFEWSAPPGAEPEDPETWRACMPALGHTIDIDAIKADFEAMDLAEFRRAYLNQWPEDALAGWTVIPKAQWDACLVGNASANEGAPVAFAVDVTPERGTASIAAAGYKDEMVTVEVIDTRPGDGVDWVPDRLRQLCERHNPVAVVLDPSSPAGALTAALEAANVPVSYVPAREVLAASQMFYDLVAEGRLRHRDQDPLSRALAGAQRRILGEGTWAWTRKGTAVDITPLISATLAAHARMKNVEQDYDVLDSIF